MNIDLFDSFVICYLTDRVFQITLCVIHVFIFIIQGDPKKQNP